MKTNFKRCLLSKDVLFQNKHYSIESYINTNTGKINLLVTMDTKQNVFIDYPILYDNNTIGFDHPEQLPEYIKAKVRKFYPLLNSLL